MSMNPKDVIRRHLLASPVITAALATYKFDGVNEEPAIFTAMKLPEDRMFPAIILVMPGGTSIGTRSRLGGDFMVNVQVYDDNELSSAVLDKLAIDVWQHCNRNADLSPYMTAGYTAVGCTAAPPTPATDPESYPGYQITTRVKILGPQA